MLPTTDLRTIQRICDITSSDWTIWQPIYDICDERRFWITLLTHICEPLLLHYESCFRGDLRLRKAIQLASNEILNEKETKEVRQLDLWFQKKETRLRGCCDMIIAASIWALRTQSAAAMNFHPQHKPLPNFHNPINYNKNDWLCCAFYSVHYALHSYTRIIRLQRKSYPPTYKIATQQAIKRIKLKIITYCEQLMKVASN